MSSRIQRLARLIAKDLISTACCPECGAPLTGEVCEYCGAPAPSKVFEKAIEIATKYDTAIQLEEIRKEFSLLKSLVISVLSEASSASLAGGTAISGLITSLKAEGLEALWKSAPQVAKFLDDFEARMKKFEKAYRMRKFADAARELSRALLSAPSNGGLIAIAVPLSLYDASIADVDGDKRKELVLIPTVNLSLPSFVLTEGGVTLDKYLKEDGLVKPLDLEDYKGVAVWKNPNLLDVVVKLDGKEKYGSSSLVAELNFFGDGKNDIVLAGRRGPIIFGLDKEERAFTGSVASLLPADIDGDGADEVLLVNTAGKVIAVDYDGGVSVKRLHDSEPPGMLASAYFDDDYEHVFLLSGNDVISLDPPPVKIASLPSTEISLGITRTFFEGEEAIAVISFAGDIVVRIIKPEDGAFGVTKEIKVPVTAPSIVPEVKFSLAEQVPEKPGMPRWFAISGDFDYDKKHEILVSLKGSFIYIKLER